MTFDPSEGISTEQQAAETAALEQGEKLIQAQEEDRDRRMAQTDSEQEDIALIGGKFKSQEDLLKAYEALQSKLGKSEPGEEVEESEEPVEASEEATAEEIEVSPARAAIDAASKAYSETGELNAESIEALSSMDSADLVKAYLESYKTQEASAQQQAVAQADSDAIIAKAGGAEQYQTKIAWAAENFSADEITAFNQATSNTASARFAVEALQNRYQSANGYEAKLVTGGKAAPKSKVFRSQAELGRAIADPRYRNDPAYRMDVEEKLARSGDLL